MVVYYYGSEWSKFWMKYKAHVIEASLGPDMNRARWDEPDMPHSLWNIKVIRIEYSRGDDLVFVYHMALNLTS